MKVRLNTSVLTTIFSLAIFPLFLVSCVQKLPFLKETNDHDLAIVTKPATFPSTSRAAFVQMVNVIGVYTIDEYHTAILPKRNAQGYPSRAFYQELKQLCDHYGTLMSATFNHDRLTERIHASMKPPGKNAIRVLSSLKTPWRVDNSFELSDILVRRVPYNDMLNENFWTISKEPKDNYGLPMLSNQVPRRVGGRGFQYQMRGLVIKHSKPQEFIFKTDCIGDMSQIDIPAGDGDLSRKLKKVFSLRVLWHKHPREISDLFLFLIAYSRKNRGSYKWVINRNGRNVLTNDYHAFLDIQSNLIRIRKGNHYTYFYPVWFFCYEDPTVKFIVKHKKDKYHIYFNRTIDEL